MITRKECLPLFITLMLAAIAQTAHADNPALPPGSDLPTRQKISSLHMTPLRRAQLIVNQGALYWDIRNKFVVMVVPNVGGFVRNNSGSVGKKLMAWHEVKLKILSHQLVPYLLPCYSTDPEFCKNYPIDY